MVKFKRQSENYMSMIFVDVVVLNYQHRCILYLSVYIAMEQILSEHSFEGDIFSYSTVNVTTLTEVPPNVDQRSFASASIYVV